MASRKDYYDILGIRRNATEEEIEKAYRKLSRTYQVDRTRSHRGAHWRLREISEAYEILSNKEKRALYDQRGTEATFHQSFVENSGQEGWEEAEEGQWEGFEDVFEDHFRVPQGSLTVHPLPRGRDIVVRAEIEFEEAIQGTFLEIEFGQEKICTRCRGKGKDPEGIQQICQVCGGAGQIQIGLSPASFSQNCPHCGGEGRVQTQPCRHCSGKGLQGAKERVRIEVPAGVQDGCRIYKMGLGHGHRLGGVPGDLIVEIHVRPHPFFKKIGEDLHISVCLTPWEAALGTQIEIPTLKGFERVAIPAGTTHGQTLRLKGRGAPNLNESKRGDQVISFRIDLPRDLDERSRAILAELKKIRPRDLRTGEEWRWRISQ